MKIGFDAKRAVQNNTGLGNYSRRLVEILSEYYPDDQYYLFAPEKKDNPRLQTLQSRKNTSFIYPTGLYRPFSSFWRISGIKSDLKRVSPDIFHGLSGELPVGISKTGVKSVVTIHDLIFLRYPEYYKPIDRMIYARKFRYACENAGRIIAISECTKRDIVSFFNIPEDKITVVYQGCHPDFREKATDHKKREVMERYKLPSKYIFYVGSIESRKNLLLAVKALRDLDPEIHLVAIGKRTPYQDKIEQYVNQTGLSGRVHILNKVFFEDLPACYQLASVFVFPSFFEGFGIPILEALSSCVPVIAATGSCLEEAGGPGSVYVDPVDDRELAGQIRRILSNVDIARKMSEDGRIYAQRFEDKLIASGVMKIYEQL
ncbi:MAG: glycosyltransferase family 4 protein [Dysgonamonadaceae bacterium]|jgi:glycosyltransferase involved in cell wall biosynthesis|nr:glycosyltransferase family 4 protein [Dysgonamonadaceae bacterium]